MTDSTTSTSTTTESTASASTPDSGGSVSVSSPSSTPDSRPSSFREALETAAGATGAPDPATTLASDPNAPAPATVEPGTEPVVAAEPAAPVKGPIPFERHEAILQNARDKTAREVVSQVEQRYGGGIRLQQAMASDPVGTLTQLLSEAVEHPEIGQQVVSQMARALNARRQKAIQPIETEVGPVYTADQVQQVIEQSIAQRLQPLEQERLKVQQAEARRMEVEQTAQTVKSRLSHWDRQPGFSEHKADIAAAQAALVQQGVDTWTALGLAYASVVPPKLQAKSASTLVTEAAKKAAASTGNPATVASAVRPRPTSFREALERARANQL